MHSMPTSYTLITILRGLKERKRERKGWEKKRKTWCDQPQTLWQQKQTHITMIFVRKPSPPPRRVKHAFQMEMMLSYTYSHKGLEKGTVQVYVMDLRKGDEVQTQMQGSMSQANCREYTVHPEI